MTLIVVCWMAGATLAAPPVAFGGRWETDLRPSIVCRAVYQSSGFRTCGVYRTTGHGQRLRCEKIPLFFLSWEPRW